jgi:hypothetical protein
MAYIRLSMQMGLRKLEERILPLRRVVELLDSSLGGPTMYGSEESRGFRYENPDVRHFCLLKAARTVSALNAAMCLVREGYIQEICVLIRTIAEFTTHIEFVLDPNETEKHKEEVKRYLASFFADTLRERGAAIVKAQIPQGFVHRSLGQTLDTIAEAQGELEGRTPAATLYSAAYRVYSNYVHGKYPEIMDLYGGRPGRFHLNGMSGTPKDAEILAQLDSFITTVSNTFVILVNSSEIIALVQSDPITALWYEKRFSDV